VLQQAAAERRIVLTFDRDFGELIYRSGFSGRPGVVYFRHPPRNPEDPASRLLDLLAASQAELTGMLTVIGTTEVRQRPLP
jgi:predicted nuclease of predicted toxin-antitoxin system